MRVSVILRELTRGGESFRSRGLDSDCTAPDILRKVRRRRAELARLCADLVRIPSENPPGDTTRMAAHVRRYLERRGVRTRTYEPRPGKVSVVARIGRGRPNLVLSGHLDTFPAGDGWRHPPFSGAIRGGRILGRGSGDMKAGLAVALFAAALVCENAANLRGSLTLALAADEETGGAWGTEWLLGHVPAVRGDACLIGEPSGTWAIGVGEKGVLWLRIATRGTSGHAAYGQGDSAVEKLRAALDAMGGLRGTRAKAPAAIAAILRRQRPLAERHWGAGAGVLADRLTVSVGTVRGGGQVNLIPAAAAAEVDIRLPPGMTTAAVARDIRRRIRRLGLRGLDVTVMNQCDPHVTSPGARLVRLLRAHARAVCGREPLPVVRLGYTDGRFFRRAGIPTAVYGPAVRNMGGAHESVDADEVATVAAIHCGAILEYLGGGGARG